MASTPTETVTRLIGEYRSGCTESGDLLFEVVYDELREIARIQRLRWHGQPSLRTTALVNEAYLKLAGANTLDVKDRGHLYALAARAMRQILSNQAKSRKRIKRGGGQPHLSFESLSESALDGLVVLDDERAETLAALERAMQAFEANYPRQARVVECRFYAGLSIPETAEVMDISPATVKRDWGLAQAWLLRQLESEHSVGERA